MPSLKRPQDGSGPGYNPFVESIIKLFPMAVTSAVDLVTPSKNPEFARCLLMLGATREGLDEAVRFYDRYFNLLMTNEVNADALTSFQAADVPSIDKSFMIFQSLVVGSLMTAYHEAIVEVSQLEAIWCKSNIQEAQRAMAARLPDLCVNSVRLTGGQNLTEQDK